MALTSALRDRARRRLCAAALALLVPASALATDAVAAPDPLDSPAWNFIRTRYFGEAPYVFDARVKVSAPANVENPADVPVMVEVEGLADVEEIVVVADLNPIQKILSLKPTRALPGLSFRFKVEQSTPVRAAARTKDGVWHFGGTWLSAAGGGCTAPSGGSGGQWQGHLGEMNARLWKRDDGQRLRLRVIHPMDTGLAAGIPAFYIDRIVVRDAQGAELATLETYEPVSENPVISLDLRYRGPVTVDGHDIQGNRFTAEIAP